MPLQHGIAHALTTNPRAGRLNPPRAALTDIPSPFVPQRPEGDHQ
ncbi:hypothetical protein [Streptomyces xylophagus]|nr:hypothetical protein [Streptomyces xylophagus]